MQIASYEEKKMDIEKAENTEEKKTDYEKASAAVIIMKRFTHHH